MGRSSPLSRETSPRRAPSFTWISLFRQAVTIEFIIAMPTGNLRAGKDVLVDCTGRVVRCSPVGNRQELAVIIDEYRFLRS